MTQVVGSQSVEFEADNDTKTLTPQQTLADLQLSKWLIIYNEWRMNGRRLVGLPNTTESFFRYANDEWL